MSLVPSFNLTVHLVLDDFGSVGRAYREADEEEADLDSVIDDLFRGEYCNPARVVAFNTAEGWARDASEDIAWAVLRRMAREGKPIAAATRGFVEFYVGQEEVRRAEIGLL